MSVDYTIYEDNHIEWGWVKSAGNIRACARIKRSEDRKYGIAYADKPFNKTKLKTLILCLCEAYNDLESGEDGTQFVFPTHSDDEDKMLELSKFVYDNFKG